MPHVEGHSEAGMGADTYNDLDHQVIRQRAIIDSSTAGGSLQASVGDPGTKFDPVTVGLERDEFAHMMRYERQSTLFVKNINGNIGSGSAQLDADAAINGGTFEQLKTDESFNPDNDAGRLEFNDYSDTRTLDHYNHGIVTNDSGPSFSQQGKVIDFYDWPTGGPVLDRDDSLTLEIERLDKTGLGEQLIAEIRYDFWWEVEEVEGSVPNPFSGGRVGGR